LVLKATPAIEGGCFVSCGMRVVRVMMPMVMIGGVVHPRSVVMVMAGKRRNAEGENDCGEQQKLVHGW
jgi:hypothetical protein